MTNSFFGVFQPLHPLLRLAVEAATANIEARITDKPTGIWFVTGPGIFTSIYLLGLHKLIDSFIEYAANTVLEPSARLLCELIDNTADIVDMWKGIDLRPLRDRATWCIKDKAARKGHPRWYQSKLESIYR